MADPNPPPTLDAPPTSPPPVAEQNQIRSLDDAIEHCMGEFGWKQFLQSTLVSFAWFFDAQQAFITVFTDREPKWNCNNSNTSCNVNSDICQLPRNSWSWDLPTRTTTISEWSLQCATPIIRGLPASSFLLGSLVGGLVLATLADSKMGRKNTLVLSCLIMSISGALTAVSTNIWMYVGLKFISGFGRSTIGTCAIVHASELVGKKWRGKVGMIGLILFNLGFITLPLIAFLLREYSWRLIYICTCCPGICYSLLVYFTVQESPRWLFIKGKKEEFIKTLKSLATSPQHLNILTESFFENYMEEADKLKEPHLYSALKILVNKSWVFKRLLVSMIVGFGVGMSYYGMPLGLGNLSFNLYLSVALNAVADSLSSLILFFVIGKMKRKRSVVGWALLSGICSVASVFVKMKGMQIVLELLSFFSTGMVYGVLLVYTLELFPTSVRNSAVSMTRETVLFGGFIAPLLVQLGKKNEFLSYGVFGVTIAVCALFATLMPETKGRKLFDTMEEEERNTQEVKNSVNSA
ncbi:hypothetical protein DH2020_008807 [Rehmannia glutinosa]|uniref:Major facilitator superfamily (MFS) profile domain-containing protein n=1 Tax=Rehmannia glutinosa TaxID=99300 RepID=A0ABR0X7N7_REHGL